MQKEKASLTLAVKPDKHQTTFRQVKAFYQK